jgi:hypothetical protein
MVRMMVLTPIDRHSRHGQNPGVPVYIFSDANSFLHGMSAVLASMATIIEVMSGLRCLHWS